MIPVELCESACLTLHRTTGTSQGYFNVSGHIGYSEDIYNFTY